MSESTGAGRSERDHPGEQDHLEDARERLLEAALAHVPFDGWTDRTLRAAVADSGVDPGLARLAFPRGGVDMALYFHRRADRRLAEELARQDLGAMRMRERIAHAVRRRIELMAEHREAVRRAAALFALPPYVPDGMRALWHTVDTIWKAVGDDSRDISWYTKRLTLAAVYSATVLYWLGDTSPGATATWDFLERRIDEVMAFEKVKAQLRNNPLVRLALWGPAQLARLVRTPPPPGPPADTAPDTAPETAPESAAASASAPGSEPAATRGSGVGAARPAGDPPP